MSKKLSIIVPVYNMAAEGKLNYCLDSLVGQTIRGVHDYEILCVDDASTDGSLEILLDYQKRYPELICVIPNAVNLRQGGAKNVGLKNAEGEWIGFIDSDDWVSPDYYEKLLKKAEETAAPAGYNQLTEDITIVLDKNGSATIDGAPSTPGDAHSLTTDVANSTGTVLPETGGTGIMIFVALGALAVICAGVFLVTNKRMSKESF